MLLGVENKKGDPANLDGRLTVYAIIDLEPGEVAAMKHPIAAVVHNGLLVAQGNFRDQNNLRDFLQSEMGLSLEEGLEEIIQRLEGLESALDPQKLKEKIEGMREFEDFIPTPAKIVSFHTEAEILAQDGDVYFMGRFEHIGNANLSVNSFPILYQARYREQQLGRVRGEIELLISQIEKPAAIESRPGGASSSEMREKLLREFIPDMLYCRKDAHVFASAQSRFREYMRGNASTADVDAIVKIISEPAELTKGHFRLLELRARKIAEIHGQNPGEAEKLRRDIEGLERELSQ
jgi:hypothetical protein